MFENVAVYLNGIMVGIVAVGVFVLPVAIFSMRHARLERQFPDNFMEYPPYVDGNKRVWRRMRMTAIPIVAVLLILIGAGCVLEGWGKEGNMQGPLAYAVIAAAVCFYLNIFMHMWGGLRLAARTLDEYKSGILESAVVSRKQRADENEPRVKGNSWREDNHSVTNIDANKRLYGQGEMTAAAQKYSYGGKNYGSKKDN